MLSSRAIRIWRRIHSWSSLVCTAFLLLLCITGLPLIFHEEIDDWLGYSLEAPALPQDTPHVSLDRVVRAAQDRFPGEFVQFFAWDDDDPNVIKVGVAPIIHAPASQVHWLAIDARTANIILELQRSRKLVTDFLLKLHRELLIGLSGSIVVGIAGFSFVAALVSGVFLYVPSMRKLPFGAIRNSRRKAWLDLHNFLGITIAAWMIVLGVTGVINTMAVPLFALWQAKTIPAVLEQYKDQSTPTHLISVQSAIDVASKALPNNRPAVIVYPYARVSSPAHYLIWMKGGTPVTARLFTPVFVDHQRGTVAAMPAVPWYLRTLQMSRPLHFGDYGGLPLKIIWALLDLVTIVILGSGLYLWLSRRSSSLAAGEAELVESHTASEAAK